MRGLGPIRVLYKSCKLLLLLTSVTLVGGCLECFVDTSNLTIWVSVSPDSVRSGESVEVTVDVINRTDHEITLEFGSSCTCGIKLYSEEKEIAYLHPRCIKPQMVGYVRPLRIPRRQSYSEVLWVHTEDLVPGTYLVRGGMMGPYEYYPWAESQFVVVRQGAF